MNNAVQINGIYPHLLPGSALFIKINNAFVRKKHYVTYQTETELNCFVVH